MAIQKISKNAPILDEHKTMTFATGGSKLFNLLPKRFREYINRNRQEALLSLVRVYVPSMLQNIEKERLKNVENMKRTMESMSRGSQRQ